MQKAKVWLSKAKLWLGSVIQSDGIKRVFHTFWQAAGGVLFATLVTAKSTSDVRAAVAVAVAAGLAAVKALVVGK